MQRSSWRCTRHRFQQVRKSQYGFSIWNGVSRVQMYDITHVCRSAGRGAGAAVASLAVILGDRPGTDFRPKYGIIINNTICPTPDPRCRCRADDRPGLSLRHGPVWLDLLNRKYQSDDMNASLIFRNAERPLGQRLRQATRLRSSIASGIHHRTESYAVRANSG
jgi:hypothetical protein